MMPAIAMTSDWEPLKAKANFAPQAMVLEMCVALSMRVPGHIVEFGVARGHSARTLRDALDNCRQAWPDAPYPDKAIFACDSFDGLPEPFESLEKGYFACEPPSIDGVECVVGRFDASLTRQLADRIGRVAFAHLDADLFASTLTALTFLGPLVETGSLLLFDQFDAGEDAEHRALNEWRRASGIRTLQIAEFARPPSGGASRLHRRVVHQVLGASDLPGDREIPRALARARPRPVDYVTVADVVSPADALRLGRNWYPLEVADGQAFRWVNNDAEIASDTARRVAIDLEPGPGLGTPSFSLEIHDLHGRPVSTIRIDGRQLVDLDLAAGLNRLHVRGGGKPVGADTRTLSFRVFRIRSLPESSPTASETGATGQPSRAAASRYRHRP